MLLITLVCRTAFVAKITLFNLFPEENHTKHENICTRETGGNVFSVWLGETRSQ